jgi:NAD dependent epimerase/dehydratase
MSISRSVLVTGAGGFIGSHLTELLVRRGHRVRAFIHYNSRNDWGSLELLPDEIKKEIQVVAGDVTDPFSVRKAVDGSQTVFHLAALIGIPYSYYAPHSYVSTNVVGTLNVMQACRDCEVEKVVHTSTSETYGTAVYAPIDERHPLQGQSPYSASKIGADMLAESYYRSFGLPVATVRPFNTYGPRQSARAVIPSIISQILAGKTEIQLGSLTPVRDLNFVEDTVRGFLQVSEASACAGEVINIGYGEGISIGDLAAMIIRLIARDVRIVCDEARVRPENSEVFKLICANAKAKELAGWEPAHTLKEGLNKTIAFVEKHLHLYKFDSYVV